MAAAAAPPVLPASAAPVRTPGYYVRQRLLANGPAMAGLAFIVLCTGLALLGYLILPDPTPNANDGLVQLQKQPPGTAVTILHRPLAQGRGAEPSVLQRWWGGAPARSQAVAIAGYRIVGDTLRVQPYRVKGALAEPELRLALPEATGRPGSAAELQRLVEQEHIEQRTYWLGTDKAGRDVLSRLLLGTRISLGIGLVAVLISLLIGVTVGAVAGYAGGWLDSLLLGLMTVVWSIPGIMLVIAISLAFGSKGVWTSFVAVGLTMWVDVARVVRGQMLSLREKTFVEAGRVLGLPTARLLARHLLPNLLGPLIVIATSNFAAAILLEAGLSFLGLGVQPPAPSWGLMVKEGYDLLGTRAGLWLTLLPSTAISLLVLSFNLLGNGLRDAYDPKTPLG
ncbi:ABC transporter permease [Hymenobacter sp. B81]|uniref:ABC transporter permease n=1 Tax=Hymenobacter sp. B81 TaxID=3344878 RepID=UPI0037DD6D51